MKEMTDYGMLSGQAESILETEPWYVAAMSNISALLMESIQNLNWVGFYLLRGDKLIIGPFQGKPACIHIPSGHGVCGAAVEQAKTIVVPDVHLFPGHIACDTASRSEIVIPIYDGNKIAAVLDVDSPIENRFSSEDEEGLQKIVKIIEERILWRKE